jgi:hypothetical protein
MSHLQFHQRQAIYAGIQAGKSDAQIAREIEVHRSTVGREIKRSGGRENYKPMQAHQDAKERQCDAMILRNTYSLGMDLFTVLQKRNAFYRYLSENHSPFLDLTPFRYSWLWYNYFFRNQRNRFTIGEGGSGSLGGLNNTATDSSNTNSGNSNASSGINNDNTANELNFAFSLACTANTFALFLMAQLSNDQKFSVPSENCNHSEEKDNSTEFFHHAWQIIIPKTSGNTNEFEFIKMPYTFQNFSTSLPATIHNLHKEDYTSSSDFLKLTA